ncbi:MAG: VanZ family protein [Gemmatimonadales bacterium]
MPLDASTQSPQIFTRARWPARVFYVGILLTATLWPFTLDYNASLVAERLARALSPTIVTRDIIDGARNVVLFAGWGLVWAVTGRGNLRRLLWNATFTGMCVSILVEAAQLFSRDRNPSILDVITNTAGAFGGALALVVLALIVRSRRDEKSYLGLPALTFAGGYATACALETWIPLFRQETVLGAVGHPFNRLRVAVKAIELSSVLDPPVIDVLLFAPLGVLAVAALFELGVGYRRGARIAATFGVVMAVVMEFAHGLLGLPISVGSMITHAAAIAMGAFIGERLVPAAARQLTGVRRIRSFVTAYAVLLALWSLRPFVPEFDTGLIAQKLDRRWWMPLASLGMRMDFYSVVDVCSPFFLYLPLGALLAVWPLRRHGPLRGPLPGVYLAMLLEALQLLVTGRLPDITDALVQASAVLVGWAIMRRTGYPRRGSLLAEPRVRGPGA